jgi:hypothetical protein
MKKTFNFGRAFAGVTSALPADRRIRSFMVLRGAQVRAYEPVA